MIAQAIGGRIRVVAAASGTFYGQPMTAGDIYTVAGGGSDSGSGIPALQAELALPAGVTTDGHGNLVVADALNGDVRVVAVSNGMFYGQNMTAGDIYTVASNLGVGGEGGTFGPTGVTVDFAGNLAIADPLNGDVQVLAVSSGIFYSEVMTAGQLYDVAGGGTTGLGDGGLGTNAEISPYAIAVDAQGNLVITDQGNGRIRGLTERTNP